MNVGNKTESGIRSARDVLKNASEVFHDYSDMKNDVYVFYSRKDKSAVVTTYENGQFVVITNRPVIDPQRKWGMSVGLSGALTIPEIRASAALSHTAKTQVGKAEDLPETALRGRHDAVDYTEEVTKRLGIKRSEDGAIQVLNRSGRSRSRGSFRASGG